MFFEDERFIDLVVFDVLMVVVCGSVVFFGYVYVLVLEWWLIV